MKTTEEIANSTPPSEVEDVLNSSLPPEVESALNALEKKLNEKFPAGIPRHLIGEVTGHLLHPRTCANEDSLGCGISGRFKLGRNTIYPVSGTMTKLRSKVKA